MPKGIYERVYRPAANFKDLTGQRFGKRVVISRAPTPVYRGKLGSSMWHVRCDCGKESIVQTSAVKKNISCGCDTESAKRSGETRRSPIPRKIRTNDGHRKRTYGLSSEDFQKLIDSQNNRCWICQEIFTRTPHIDHNHSCCSGIRSCGKCVRGLLCHSCNCGLGNFHDRSDLLHRAIKYLGDQNDA